MEWGLCKGYLYYWLDHAPLDAIRNRKLDCKFTGWSGNDYPTGEGKVEIEDKAE